MKIYSFKIDFFLFLLALIFLAFPPVILIFFNNSDYSVISFSNISFTVIFQFLISAFLYYFYQTKIDERRTSSLILFKYIMPGTFVFCILFCVSLVIKYISIVSPMETINMYIEKPVSLFPWIYAVLNFFMSAFYEEILYRFYLPDILYNFFKKKNLIVILIFEFITLLLFAFGHLSSGYLAVINAALAHIVLRLCYKLTGSVFPGFIAHSIYNIMSLILL